MFACVFLFFFFKRVSVTDTAGQLGECPFGRSKWLSDPPPHPSSSPSPPLPKIERLHMHAFPSTRQGLAVIVWTFPDLIYQPPLIVNEACYGPAAIKDETAKQHAHIATETGRNTDVIVGGKQDAHDWSLSCQQQMRKVHLSILFLAAVVPFFSAWG